MPYAAGLLCTLLIAADPITPINNKEGLQALQSLIGSWKATGTIDGPAREFWRETLTWEWHFKGTDCYIATSWDKGKYLKSAEMRYLPEQKLYQWKVKDLKDQVLEFTGTLRSGNNKESILTLEHKDGSASERLVITLLHSNRFLYRLEKPIGGNAVARQYQVGATKEGEPFAVAPTGPECIVSGGRGTMAVSYQGKTYYVCCSGCRDAFKDEPEKYIKEAAARKEKK